MKRARHTAEYSREKVEGQLRKRKIDPYSKRGEEIMSRMEELLAQGEDPNKAMPAQPGMSGRTQIILALIGLFGAIVPGVFSVIILYLDRTLPTNAEPATEQPVEIPGLEDPHKVFQLLGEPDDETGDNRHVIFVEGEEDPVDVVRAGGRWLPKDAWRDEIEYQQLSQELEALPEAATATPVEPIKE